MLVQSFFIDQAALLQGESKTYSLC